MSNHADRDFFTPANYANGFPHEAFTRLRAEDPVHWTTESFTPEYPFTKEPGPGYWAITRHADVDRVVRTPGVFSSHVGGTMIVNLKPGPLALQQRQMLNMDPPEHSRLRRIINRAFTPKAVEGLRADIENNTTRILDTAGAEGEVDFVTAVAAELPLMMLCGLLGVPLEDRHLLFDWTERLTVVRSFDDFLAATDEMNAYCLAHSATKRANPTGDVWSTLVNAELAPDDADDGVTRLTDDDLLMFWQLLVIAGNETTRNATSGGVLALVEHPDQATKLHADPTLMPSAVEEVLRWVSPVNHFRRTATEDVEFGGTQIKAGDKVVVYYASANRDEDVFTDPFRFDITRNPNPHLGFGAGPHFCLGAPLARLQLRTMLTELLRRYPRSRITGPITRAPITFLSGITSMPVELRP
jgi:cytochrome P450